jgi:glycosyltransferase involved in cell wall biosynthesis
MATALLVSPYLPPHIGGVERYVDTVARELERLDWRVIIATTGQAGDDQVQRLPRSSIEVRYLHAWGKVSNTPVGIRWHAELCRIIDEDGVDVVNAHAPVPGLADVAERAARDVPFVLTYHAGPMTKNRAAVNLSLRAYEQCVVRRTVRRSSALICSSSYVRDFLQPFCQSTPVEVIPPGVDVSHYSLPVDEARSNLLFVGSLERSTRYKALDSLLDALALLRRQGVHLTLDVVGEGSFRPDYEAQCADLAISDRVTFHGAADPVKLKSFYQRASALVVPSRFDSFPTVIVEALACGTPVIASRVGGIPTVVRHQGNGLLVEPGQVEELARALTRLTADTALAATLGLEGRRTVERSLTSSVQGRRTAAVLEGAISRGRPSSSRHRARPATVEVPGRRKLLMVSPYFPPHVGGVEQYARHLALALVATGRWEVTVVTTKGRGLRTERRHEDGLDVYRLAWWARYSYTPFSPLWPWQLRHIIRHVDPDIVNAHTPVPLLSDVAAWASGDRPFLLTYHAAALEKDAGWLFGFVQRLYEFLERFTLRRADAVLAVSDFVHGALRARVPGRLVTFTNAVPRTSLSETAAQPLPGQFVFIARLDKEHRWKGLELILEALTYCPQAHLLVVGDGDIRHVYEKTAAELGVADRVQFTGTVTGAAKDAMIQTSVALIAYPTTSNDAFPTVLLEAWANRTPVVTADIGALRTVVRHGVDGYLVPALRPRALADALQQMIDEPGVTTDLGEQGRQRVADMTWDRQADRFERLVDTLGGASARPGQGQPS